MWERFKPISKPYIAFKYCILWSPLFSPYRHFNKPMLSKLQCVTRSGVNSCELWMNEWCIYIALYCILLYTQSALQSWGGSLLNHHQCAASTWMMRRQPQDNGASALTTHQLQVERRESDGANQVDRDCWEAMIDKGQWREFGQDTRVTPLLFTRSAMGFLMTTESQDLGLTSHPKDGAFWQYSVPVTTLGR